MARTAPFPNMAAIPGMNPGVFVMGGGGDGGGSGAGGGNGKGGGQGANGKGGGKDAPGGGKSADGNTPCGGGCGGPHPLASRGDPVDVLSGRVSTVPAVDFCLPGPLPLSFARGYDSGARERDTGFGFGWSNPLAWEIEIRRRDLVVWDEEGSPVRLPTLESGAEALGPRGWSLRCAGDTFELETLDEIRRTFEKTTTEEGDPIAVLKRVCDRNGNNLEIERSGRVLSAFRDSAGRRVEAERGKDGRVTRLVALVGDELGERVHLVDYAYDVAGNLVRMSDADGHVARFTYDEDGDHRLIGATNRCGVTSHYRYDAHGRCVETWSDLGGRADTSLVMPATLADGSTKPKGAHHHVFTYSGDGYTEVAGVRTVERFMGSTGGRIDTSIHGGAVVSRRYNEMGHLVGFEDGLGDATVLDRDARGRWLCKTEPGGRVTSCVRDTHGRIVEEMDPAGGVRRARYDERGNTVEIEAPDGAITTHTYDSRGQMLTWTDANGAVSRAEYDEAGNWVAVTLPGGARWTRTFDGLGRKVSETNPQGGVKRFRRSPRSDVLEIQNEAGGVTTFTYDGEHRVTSETTPTGAQTHYSYGVTGELHKVAGPTGEVFEIRRTLDGAIAEVRNENGDRHVQSWDSRGNLLREETFDGREIAYRHDLGDQLIGARYEPSGAVVTLSYDDAGRLIRRELPDGEVETYEHDALGHVVFAANRETTCLFAWDPAGRLVREEQRMGGDVCVVETEYSPTGQPVRRRSSLGHVEKLSWSARGEMLAREVNGVVVHGATSDMLGRERERSLPGGGRIVRVYDAAGRLAGIQVASPERVAVEIRNQHRPDGSTALTWDSRHGGTRRERDEAGRLTHVVSEDGARRAFSFDAANNLFEEGDGRAYEPGGRVARYREATLRYDSEGRITERCLPGEEGRWLYDWTDGGRLRSVVAPGGERIDFVYDCFGRRLLKRTRATAVRFVWAGDELLHDVRTAGDATAVRTYLFEPGSWAPMAHRDGAPAQPGTGGEWVHYVTDALGAPLFLVGGDGGIVEEVRRSPWGKLEQGSLSPIGLPGQYIDEETGLAYHRFRYYDPALGRFLSPDPLGIGGGADLYGYPPDPTEWADPLGLRFPDSVKQATLDDNRMQNGGDVKCSNPACSVTCIQPVKSTKGDTRETRPSMMREWQLDHVDPKSRGGPDTRENCQVLCRRCNRAKSSM